MTREIDALIKQLINHSEPFVRWKTKREIFDLDPLTPEYQAAKNDLESSQVLHSLLVGRDNDGRLPYHPYDKWFGAHWVLSILADLDYPPGDEDLKPLLEQCYTWLLSEDHAKYIRTINGRVRRCASQEGNCIYYSLALGLADERTQELATRLMRWQWEDGGWNCDKHPEAIHASFNESLIPLRGLAWYAKISSDPKVRQAVSNAAEVFLQRDLFRRMTNNQVIDNNFIELHYPNYWHYDVLFALKVMAEAGFIKDSRCSQALDLIESKQLMDGGFPAEAKYYRVDDKQLSGHSKVDWGGVSKVHMNPYVSVDAISVLLRAGRLQLGSILA